MSIALIAYQDKSTDVIHVLTKMQRSIENYEKKKNYNANWSAERRAMLSILANFVQHANDTILTLEQQRSVAYTEGIQRGKEIADRGKTNSRSDRFFDKEGYRMRTIAEAGSTWNF